MNHDVEYPQQNQHKRPLSVDGANVSSKHSGGSLYIKRFLSCSKPEIGDMNHDVQHAAEETT